MESAKSAMERISLRHDLTTPTPSPANGLLTPTSSPSIFDRILQSVHKFFYTIVSLTGSFILRTLSTLVLLTGILVAVGLQFYAFYYTGVLNLNVVVACILYAPALAAVAVLREETILNGTNQAGLSPVMTTWVTMAYLVISLSIMGSLIQPLVLRMWNIISARDMGVAIGGTICFYYNLLVSEVLFSTALNLKRVITHDEELNRRRREDPPWMTAYESIRASKSTQEGLGNNEDEGNDITTRV